MNMKALYFLFAGLLATNALFARHSVNLPVRQIAEQHNINLVLLVNDEGNEFLIPQESLGLIPTIQPLYNSAEQPISCGALPSSTLETVSQALWSFYYSKELSSFQIMQHICQDAYLPWLKPEELAALNQTASALGFELLTKLSQIQLLELVSNPQGEKPAHFIVPSDIALQSPVINNFMQTPAFSLNKEVVLYKISAVELDTLARALWALYEFKEAQDQLTLAKNIIEGSGWGKTDAEQFHTAASILKTAHAIELPHLASIAAKVLIAKGTDEQIKTYIAGLSNDGSVRMHVAQELASMTVHEANHEKLHERIGLSVKERWLISKHELLDKRLRGTRYDLSDCHIKDLEGLNLLPDVHKVTELILSDNKLKDIDTNHLVQFQALTTLDLSHNNIKTLDIEPLFSLPSLRTLKLRGNGFSDDEKKKLYGQLTKKNIEPVF